MGNQNPSIEEEQTTQWKSTKDKNLQNMHIKLKIEYNEPHKKLGVNSGAPEGSQTPEGK
jgi:hypothetical protein